jgi:NAD(P)-dependent dehydrogenase (short-subunit alcohol dehydrogenase family)
MEASLNENTYVVTGATSGIGLATTDQLVKQGAAVIGIGRSQERCDQAKTHLLGIKPKARVVYCLADLSLQSEIRALRGKIEGAMVEIGEKHLDGLVNNAGTFTYWLSLTPEGFEKQWAVNHLAPFLLTHELLPLLLAAPAARVVTVSSGSHYQGRLNWDDLQLLRRYNGLRAYQNTKLANVLFTLEFNRLMGPNGTVRGFAADPGLVNTDIGLKGTPPFVRWFWKQRSAGGKPPEVPAAGIVFLLTEPSLQNANDIYWKYNQVKRASKRALNQDDAFRLWSASELMCGIA